MKSKIFLFLIVGILVLGMVSAANWDNTKSYDKKTKTITIKNWLGIGKILRQDTLDFNSYGCLTDCSAEGTTNLYEKSKLFDGINFKDQKGIFKNKNYKFFIQKTKTITKENNIYGESCKKLFNGTTQCKNKIIEKINSSAEVFYWERYNGITLDEGTYKWRIEGKKSIKENIDWIVNSQGKEYVEWAWWNTTFTKCRTFQLTSGVGGARTSQPLTINLTGLTNKLTNNQDVRIVNASCDNDGTEQNRTIVDSGSDWATSAFAYTGTPNENYSVYYKNNSVIDVPNNETQLTFFDEFNDGSFDTGKWTLDVACSLTESGGLLNTTFNGVGGNCGQDSLQTVRTFTDDYLVQSELYSTDTSNTLFFSHKTSGTDASNFELVFGGGNALELYGYNGAVEIFSPIGGANVFEFTTWWMNVTGADASLYKNSVFNFSKSSAFYIGTRQFMLNSLVDTGVHTVSYNYFRVWNNSVNVYEDVPTIVIYAEENVDLIPTITLNSPVNAFNSTSQSITFNGTVSDDMSIVNVSLILNGIYNETNTSGINASDYTFPKTFADGNYNWTLEACDNKPQCINATTRNFTIDTSPPQLTVTSPVNITTFLTVGDTLNFNYSVVEPNIDSCWYNYNSTNFTVNCTGISVPFNTTIKSNLTFYANDTLGQENNTFWSWNVPFFVESEIFDASALEGGSSIFQIGVFTNGTTITLANLSYNNTQNLGDIYQNGNNFTINETITIPPVNADVNYTFFWKLTQGGITSTTPHNQTITNFGIDDCSVGTFPLFNLTLLDEETQLNFTLDSATENTTIEVDINLFSLGTTTSIQNFSQGFTNINPARVCLTQDLNNSQYTLDSTFKYFGDLHAVEYYNIQKLTLTNSTDNQLINLYDLKTASGTEFQVSFKDNNFLVTENALIQLDRQYVSEGVFKTVEIPKTDSNGQAVLHMDEKDIVYNIVVTKDNTILGTFLNIVPFCEDTTTGLCLINLGAFTSGEALIDYNELIDISYNLDYNETSRVATFTFASLDGSAKNITLKVNKVDSLGGLEICDSNLVTSSGTILCPVPVSVGNETLYAEVFEGSEKIISTFKSTKSTTDFGILGYLAFFMFFVSLLLMFTDSKTGIIIASLIGIMGGSLLGFTSGGLLGIGTSFIWLLVAGMILLYKLNEDTGGN